MSYPWRAFIRAGFNIFRALLSEDRHRKLHYVNRLNYVFQRTFTRTCPICGYYGFFLSAGYQNRPEAMCPQCGSLERHRLLYLAIMSAGQSLLEGKDVLHFAPERCLAGIARRSARRYLTADFSIAKEQLDISEKLDMSLDISALGLANCVVDIVLCSHVLDQVCNDRLALRELFRILRPRGIALISVPIVEGWVCTYEDDAIVDRHNRIKYFGFDDRVRSYGRDFSKKMEEAGFIASVFQPSFKSYGEHSLVPGDKIFIGLRP